MDENLRQLERKAYSSGELPLLQQLYQKLLRASADLDSFVRLRNYVESLIPEDILGDDDVSDEIAQEPVIALARELSRHLVRNNYDYYAGTLNKKVDYDNPPPGASTWAFIEVDETEHWTESAQKNVVALTGVYLVDTGKDAWYVDNNGHYIARRDLRYTFGWQWVPQAEIDEIIEDLGLEDMADQESQRALQDGIIEYYAGSPPF
jgi:hypothetical protein